MLTLAITLFLAAWGGASDTQAKAQNAVGQRVIYEMNVGSFTTEGTFAAAQARLAELQQTGIDVIWLMPVYPRGSSRSPYAVMDFTDVNSAYGTVDDLKHLVAEAHLLGMKSSLTGYLTIQPTSTRGAQPIRHGLMASTAIPISAT